MGQNLASLIDFDFLYKYAMEPNPALAQIGQASLSFLSSFASLGCEQLVQPPFADLDAADNPEEPDPADPRQKQSQPAQLKCVKAKAKHLIVRPVSPSKAPSSSSSNALHRTAKNLPIMPSLPKAVHMPKFSIAKASQQAPPAKSQELREAQQKAAPADVEDLQKELALARTQLENEKLKTELAQKNASMQQELEAARVEGIHQFQEMQRLAKQELERQEHAQALKQWEHTREEQMQKEQLHAAELQRHRLQVEEWHMHEQQCQAEFKLQEEHEEWKMEQQAEWGQQEARAELEQQEAQAEHLRQEELHAEWVQQGGQRSYSGWDSWEDGGWNGGWSWEYDREWQRDEATYKETWKNEQRWHSSVSSSQKPKSCPEMPKNYQGSRRAWERLNFLFWLILAC